MWMHHTDNQLHLEKAHSDRPMRHTLISYGTWRGPNLITECPERICGVSEDRNGFRHVVSKLT